VNDGEDVTMDSLAPSRYTLAVSMKVMPNSRARSRIRLLFSSPCRQPSPSYPKFIVPRQSRLTDSPVEPSVVYSIRGVGSLGI
jgi:hypothetical protein